MDSLSITAPDDWHVHLRDGTQMAHAVHHTAKRFARAIVMPNLKPPVTTVEAARAYRDRILGALAPGERFEPLMTLYLTDGTSPEEIGRAAASGFVKAVKYYPAGATTNSDSGVTALERAFPALEAMQKHDLPLLVHGEVTTTGVDVFDREKAFVDSSLGSIVKRFPSLRVVLEHATTREAVEFVKAAGPRVAATLTAHHLLYSRNSIFEGGIRPHYYCLPILKREEHRRALIAAASSGSPKFFLGTDSAPHPRDLKEHPCGCAGIFTAHAAIELYAEAFEGAGALDRLEGFASFHGADFYGLPRNKGKIALVKQDWMPPADYPFGESRVVPLRAGEKVSWRLQ
jgi:dihydroorotase